MDTRDSKVEQFRNTALLTVSYKSSKEMFPIESGAVPTRLAESSLTVDDGSTSTFGQTAEKSWLLLALYLLQRIKHIDLPQLCTVRASIVDSG